MLRLRLFVLNNDSRRKKSTKRPIKFQFKAGKIIINSSGFSLEDAYKKACSRLQKIYEAALEEGLVDKKSSKFITITHYRERTLPLSHFLCQKNCLWRKLNFF